MIKPVLRSKLFVVFAAAAVWCGQPAPAADLQEQGIIVAQNQGAGQKQNQNQNQSNQTPLAPLPTPDLYPYGTPRQIPGQYPVPSPAQNAPVSPDGTRNVELPSAIPGTVPGQMPTTPTPAPNQTPDAYPYQTPRQTPDQFPNQIPPQSPDQLTPQLSTAPFVGQSTVPVVVPGIPPQLLQGTTTSMLLLPDRRQIYACVASVSCRQDISGIRLAGEPKALRSPVPHAVEQKSPEGIESDRTFQKDMYDRIERFDRRIDKIELNAQNASPDQHIVVERKIEALRRGKDGVRSSLQDFVAPCPSGPKEYDRSQIENAMDRLESSQQRVLDRTRNLDRQHRHSSTGP